MLGDGCQAVIGDLHGKVVGVEVVLDRRADFGGDDGHG